MDDSRNTDNAWMETVVLNFHDEPRKTLGDFEFEVRSGSKKILSIKVGKSMCIYNQLEYLFNPGEWQSQKREANFFTLTGVYVTTCKDKI